MSSPRSSQPDLGRYGQALEEASSVDSEPPPSVVSPVSVAFAQLWSGVFKLVALLAFAYALRAMSALLVPLVTALLLTFVLRPPVHRLSQLSRLPIAPCAALVLLLFLAGVGYGIYRLAEPAAEWAARAPGSMHELRSKIDALREHTAVLDKAQTELKELARGARDSDAPEEVVIRGPGIGGAVLGRARELGIGVGVVLILLYFLLASSDLFLRKTVEVVPRLRERKRVVETVREIEDDISAYLLTITLINLGLAAVVSASLALLGVPNPTFWGVVAGLMNFIPYLGGIVTFTLLCIVSILSFDDLGPALLPPLVFASLNAIEGFIVTPHILGHRLLLNPVIVLLNLFFWTWAWGPVGALLSAPLLVVFKATTSHVPSLEPIGTYISA